MNQIIIQCPKCLERESTKYNCTLCCSEWGRAIPDLRPRELARDPVRMAEIRRYDRVAQQGPATYEGHADAKPELRAWLVRELLEALGVTAFAEIGPGFGELLAVTSDFERVAIDHSFGFLQDIKRQMPKVRCVLGLADCLPLAYTPALVADSVFQALPYKEAFLCEAARVADVLVMSVAFRWNYPRRPQQGFDVTKPEERQVLVRFLEELGFEVELRWLGRDDWQWNPDGDLHNSAYLYLVCKKHGETNGA